MIAVEEFQAINALSKKTAAFADQLDSWVPWNLYISTDGVCVYCGEQSQCRDHLIPVAFMMTRARDGSEMRRGMTIDACTECNAILSSKIYFSFYDRLASARILLTRRYKKYYSMPEWGYDELDELTGLLKDHVYSRQMCRSVIVERLNWQFTKPFHLLVGTINRRISDYSTNSKLLEFFGIDSWQIGGAK